MLVHEKKQVASKDIVTFIRRYVVELDGLESKAFTPETKKITWQCPLSSTVKIDFDGAFDSQGFKVTLGIITRDDSGSVLLEHSILQDHVASVFTAEALDFQFTERTRLENGWWRVIVEGDSLSIV